MKCLRDLFRTHLVLLLHRITQYLSRKFSRFPPRFQTFTETFSNGYLKESSDSGKESLPLEVALLSRHVIINDRPNSVAETGQIYDSQDAQQYLFIRNCKCDSCHILLQYGNPRYIFILQFKLPMMSIFRYSP